MNTQPKSGTPRATSVNRQNGKAGPDGSATLAGRTRQTTSTGYPSTKSANKANGGKAGPEANGLTTRGYRNQPTAGGGVRNASAGTVRHVSGPSPVSGPSGPSMPSKRRRSGRD